MIRVLPADRKDDRQRLTAFAADLIDGCLDHQHGGAPNFDHPGTSTEAQAFALMMEAAGQKVEMGQREAERSQEIYLRAVA